MPTASAESLLAQLLPQWHDLLQSWALDGRLSAAAREALQLNAEPDALKNLTTQWSAGNFSALPPITLLSPWHIGGAMGAYSASEGTIYLNENWLATARQEQAFSVLTEELGHHLDKLLNMQDTQGDEGELFAEILKQEDLKSKYIKSDLEVASDLGFADTGSGFIVVENSSSPIIRGNSVYARMYGPTWETALSYAAPSGGTLASIDDAGENEFLVSAFSASGDLLIIGITDKATEGSWKWINGSSSTYRNWAIEPQSDPGREGLDYGYLVLRNSNTPQSIQAGQWIAGQESMGDTGSSAILEIPLSLTTSFLGQIKEGAGEFTASIKLVAGIQPANYANGATVYWKISGITADDLSSGSMAGSGVIGDGRLDIKHSLRQDSDAGEVLEVSVFSDAAMTQRIGAKASATVSESTSAGDPEAPRDTTPPSVTMQTPSQLVDGVINESESKIVTYSGNIQDQSGLKSFGVILKNLEGGGTKSFFVSARDLDLSGNFTKSIDLGSSTGTWVFESSSAEDNAGNRVNSWSVTPQEYLRLAGIDVSSKAFNFAVEKIESETVYSSVSATLNEAGKNLVLTGTGAINGTGNTLNNSLTGNSANNILNGVAGTDTMTGGLGNDTYIVDNSGDRVVEGTNAGTDTVQSSISHTLAANVENLVLTGTGAINGTGNALNNNLIGNSGSNVLIGGGSGDVLTGLGSSDTFRFSLLDSRLSDYDHITDLVIGGDRIDGPNAVSAANVRELGRVSALTEEAIAAVLTSGQFLANQAVTFTYQSDANIRTFLALNNGTSGFSAASDAVVEITGYSGSLTNLAII